MHKLHDFTGQKFGRLTVNSKGEKRGGRSQWLCTCLCGAKVRVAGFNLLNRSTQSCGCLRKRIQLDNQAV